MLRPNATFRVYLWRQPRLDRLPPARRPDDVPQRDVMWECSEWELTGGDVDEALRWADEHVASWDVAEMWVAVPDCGDGRGRGLVRIRGHNPNENAALA